MSRMLTVAKLVCSDPCDYHDKQGRLSSDLRVVTDHYADKCAVIDVRLTPGSRLCSPCRKKLDLRVKLFWENDEDDSPLVHSSRPSRCGSPAPLIPTSAADGPWEPLPPGPSPPKRARLEKKDGEYTAEDAAYIIGQLKEKMVTCVTSSEKINILSLAPPSWSVDRVTREFNTTLWFANRARELVDQQGTICPKLPSKIACNKLSAEVVQTVKDFYEDETISYCTPGIKQSITVKDENGNKIQMQKKLLLCNLDVMLKLYNDNHPEHKVGRSIFARLRPRQCVWIPPTGMENVCVCEDHQNVTLECHALRALLREAPEEVKCMFVSVDHALASSLCNPATETCYSRECAVCKEKVETMKTILSDVLNCEDVQFSHWEKVENRTTLHVKSLGKDDFVKFFIQSLKDLSWHDFLARMQISTMREKKKNLGPGEVLVCGDFAENYSFVIQNSVQGQHWNNAQATIHPFVCYYSDNDKTKHLSFVVISDCKDHDTMAVYTFQKFLHEFLVLKLGQVLKITYFSDGCSAQYKNKNNFQNLCLHELDFQTKADWHFFATSHGKNACDGVGGTVKREARRACMQSPFQNLIGTPRELFEWCTENLKMDFCYVTKEQVAEVTAQLADRIANLNSIAGTRSFHAFRPLSTSQIECKAYSMSPTSAIRTITRRRTKTT